MRLLYLFVFICFQCINGHATNSPFQETEELPAIYQGRIHPLSAVAKLWLYDFYHQEQLKSADLTAFHTNTNSALDLLWKVHFLGHSRWDNAPFFWIHHAELKSLLGLNTTQDRFSFNELLPFYEKGTEEASSYDKEKNRLLDALQLYKSYEGATLPDESLYDEPASVRLQYAGPTLKMLPTRQGNKDWVSLHALKIKTYDPKLERLVPISNFTPFSDAHFESIRSAYLAIEAAIKNEKTDPKDLHQALVTFTEEMQEAYALLVNTPYKTGKEKKLFYPSLMRLKAETWYYSFPLIQLAIGLYALALLLSTNRHTFKYALIPLFLAFLTHSTILILRCYILQRPPVSNMFETVLYVPWIAMAVGIFFYFKSRSTLILLTGAFCSLALLIILKLTLVDARFENVQAVLDSQYWLTVHVLMVVGSYGAFVLSGILGHLYLIYPLFPKKEDATARKIAQAILHTMYIGVALLIPGTILGGVWAAESWGRFWDWDPKESWAFISACVYLLIIHAYTFQRIRDFGLAVGAVLGLIAISFTWYGVNYILGIGLHSYGFGSGGEHYYFAYLVGEALFLTGASLFKKSIEQK